MEYWLAGLTAAAIAWISNRFLVSRGGDKAIIWLVPPLEEALKTGSALLLGGAIPLTHGVFGLLEAIHDYLVSPKWGLWAGLSSIVCHYLLGLGTVFFYRVYPSWILATLLTTALHIFWNLVVVQFLAKILQGRRQ